MFCTILAISFLGDLGSSKFIVREKAHLALERRMNLNLYFLLRNYRPSDQEVSDRVGKIVTAYEKKVFWPDLKGYPDYPFIDSLPVDYPGRATIISQYLQKVRGHCGWSNSWANDWPNYRLATQLWVYDQVQQHIAEAMTGDKPDRLKALQKAVDDMIVGDDLQYRGQGRKNPLKK